ncbi:DUF4166 domain-containing protein [Viridibacillus sp. YIM B01967]|uniref:DUF4166 domain-containing protein n=1 Tax=Viridibacillus soli TaxID=2798301 RepID=A0ABS1HCM7_9BACL|nr:DUF4166 domain-containing protein [Viridibacillus soli]MBK3497162.1 DUF4166 domain-containing protein [Viridibacillus soli]
MTIYQSLLGEDFHKLHPKLQERYALPVDVPFFATGTMTKIETGARWLNPLLTFATHWKFLFPENGQDVPFTIQNTCKLLSNGEAEVYWERTFYFKKGTRRFNAFMTIDAKRKVVKDYLGEPSLLYSDLKFDVTNEGRLLIRSGFQRVVLGKIELPIPRLLEGSVIVEEGYDAVRELFTIHVYIHNPIVGRVMAYAGEFKEHIC